MRIPFIPRRERPSGPVVLAARGLAAGRAALGVALVAAPDATTRRWLGRSTQDDPARQVAVRGLGGRDVVLGLGALVALRDPRDVRQAVRWLEAGVVADLTDAAATAIADELDAPRSFPLAAALGSAVLGLALRTWLR